MTLRRTSSPPPRSSTLRMYRTIEKRYANRSAVVPHRVRDHAKRRALSRRALDRAPLSDRLSSDNGIRSAGTESCTSRSHRRAGSSGIRGGRVKADDLIALAGCTHWRESRRNIDRLTYTRAPSARRGPVRLRRGSRGRFCPLIAAPFARFDFPRPHVALPTWGIA